MRTSIGAAMLAVATLAAAAALAAPPAAPSAADSEVRAFLVRTYLAEASPAWWDDHPEAVFDAALTHAINEDQRLAASPDEETLDYDPLCQCQDQTGVKGTIAGLAVTGPAAARASVALSWPGAPPKSVTLILSKTAAGWRVHDVVTTKTPSLLALLTRDNRRRGGH